MPLSRAMLKNVRRGATVSVRTGPWQTECVGEVMDMETVRGEPMLAVALTIETGMKTVERYPLHICTLVPDDATLKAREHLRPAASSEPPHKPAKPTTIAARRF